MKYYTTIDNKTSLRWGLNLPQAYLFDWLCAHVIVCQKVAHVQGDVYYLTTREQACKELPLLTDKPDTMYRYFKGLSDKGVIKIKKIDGQDFIAFNKEMTKEWKT